jgi:sigma-B regulation protein RsbU (phosphoserine phosphatase)
MQVGIRGKMIAVLVIAGVLPLCVALVAIQTLDYRYYRRDKGAFFEAIAAQMARSLSGSTEAQVQKLSNWLTFSEIPQMVAQQHATVAAEEAATAQSKIDQIESSWEKLGADHPRIQELLTSPLARKLKTFQRINPSFVEILLTDSRGRIIAVTNKSSDYWQADETWWQEAFQLGAERAYVQGISYDKSAGAYAVEISLPVIDQETEKPVGVVKAVLDAQPFFRDLAHAVSGDQQQWKLVMEDGRILFGAKAQPLESRIPEEVARTIRKRNSGWTIGTFGEDGRQLIGFDKLDWEAAFDDTVADHKSWIYVLVHQKTTEVFAPVRRQILTVVAAGGVLIVVSALLGLLIAERKLLRPIELLRSAAQTLSASANLHEGAPAHQQHYGSPKAALAQLEKIKSSDEIEDLAHDFASMGKRVLNYHRQLEEDIAIKTAEIQRDLQLAREFQEALLPSTYPEIPSGDAKSPLRLSFHHVYSPASSLGGDFFDVLKLGDCRAGIFIADVMGHGARSALVTAILRTLLQDLAPSADDPAKFLSQINTHFYDIVKRSDQTLFVTAFYLVLDTRRAIATFASAGHPSPLILSNGNAEPLIERLENNPALGVFSGVNYSSFSREIKPGDLFLLFTDGLVEAFNGDGEEFGSARLREIVTENSDRDLPAMTHAIVDAVNRFSGPAGLADDVCLVAVQLSEDETKMRAATAGHVEVRDAP